MYQQAHIHHQITETDRVQRRNSNQYSAPMLINTTKLAKDEMTKQQLRFYTIIGITPSQAMKKYNIPPIAN
jgi:hypothetical protein